MSGRTSAALLAPALAFALLVLVGPLALLLVFSFARLSERGLDVQGLTLAHYARFVADPFYWGIYGQTLALGLVTTLGTLVLGFPLAYVFSRSSPLAKKLLLVLIVSPILTSAVVRSYGWIIILGANGAVNSVLLGLGLVETPVRFLFSFGSVAVGLVQLLLPYMVLPIASVLEGQDRALEEAAASLGAPRQRIFVEVTLPLAIPGVLAGCVLVFVLAFSQFAVPRLLGGGGFLVLSTVIYQQAIAVLDWGGASAVAFVLLGTSLLVVWSYSRLAGYLTRFSVA